MPPPLTKRIHENQHRPGLIPDERQLSNMINLKRVYADERNDAWQDSREEANDKTARKRVVVNRPVFPHHIATISPSSLILKCLSSSSSILNVPDLLVSASPSSLNMDR